MLTSLLAENNRAAGAFFSNFIYKVLHVLAQKTNKYIQIRKENKKINKTTNRIEQKKRSVSTLTSKLFTLNTRQ